MWDEARAQVDAPLRVSVITVCFNAAAVLQQTMASLALQTWPHVEWVVVDGGSSDGTQALVNAGPRQPDVFISEPDAGIYDAMNKGIGLSSGDLLYFLNADDALHDATVLQEVALKFAQDPDLLFLLGRVLVQSPEAALLHGQGYINRWTLPFADPCHQSIFVRRRLFDEVGLFDLRWPASADYDWFLRVCQAGHHIRHFDRTVARYRAGGAHARDPSALWAERRAIRRRYVPSAVLTFGYLVTRVLNRLSRQFRAGLPFGYSLAKPP